MELQEILLTSTNSHNAELRNLLLAKFNNWIKEPQNSTKIDSLSDSESSALLHLLEAEISNSNTYSLRVERFNELYAFNYNLNIIASELIQLLILDDTSSSFIVGDGAFLGMPLSESLLIDGISELKNNGYWVSPVSMSNVQILHTLDCLKNFKFISRSSPPHVFSGSNLLDFVHDGNSPDPKFGDTYWLADQDKIVHSKSLNRLAFDPFILSIANGYLGCPPIHDQINVWFSFPTKKEKANLSENAQLFHQDKDFIKFLKVFIYLTDVNEGNGPHSYVEASHRDPLHDKDIPLHTRLDDRSVESIYGVDRIKTITGKAGVIVFADTSCAHKGSPLNSGSRIMLQLEYTTSLYLSQVSPFTDLDLHKSYLPLVSERFFDRVAANYSSKNRKVFGLLDYTISRKSKFLSKLNMIRLVIKGLVFKR